MQNRNLPSPISHLQARNPEFRASSGLFNPRVLGAFTLCAISVFLAMLGFAATPPSGMTSAAPSSAGGWQIVPSPNADTTRQNELNGVTCASASDCWAVGSYYTANNAYQTLIEHWDGTAWTIVASPNTANTETNVLQNATCVSASDCWAVGKHKSIIEAAGEPVIIVDQTLTQHWDGTVWTIVTSPNAQPIESYLLDVACTATSDCWAVGRAANVTTGLYETQTMHWDGNLWTLVISPNSPNTAADNYLQSVTCTSATDCWTVGLTQDRSTGLNQNLAEHWDGTTWTLVAMPNTSSTLTNLLSGVTCASASDCWAVGYADPGPGLAYRTLIERWDGTSWAIVPSPNAGANRSNFLFGVKCTSASDCWAIGRYYNGIADQTLIERWDGTVWAIVPSPNTSSTQYNDFWRVACASASDCWAVGYYIDANNIHQTLTEHYTVSPTPISAVSRKPHGTTGTFDIDLPLAGDPGIECRSGGTNGNYTLVFTFTNTLTSVGGASLTTGIGSVNSSAIGSDTHQYVVNLTGVTNAQVITVNLTNVNDSAGNSSPAVAGSMAVLIGDTTADTFVNSADISQTKSQSGNAVTVSNFRQDVTIDGFLNSADISLVKSKSGTAVP